MLIPSATGVPTLQKAVVPIEAYDDALSNDRAATGLRAVSGSWNGASTGTVISGWCGVDKSVHDEVLLSLLRHSCAVMTRKFYVSNPMVFFVM